MRELGESSEMGAEEVLAQLHRIESSPEFRAPGRARKFLRFIVEETLAGRADRLKAYSIAVEVFGRDEKFDPQGDPVVRMEAGRLRRAIERYYLIAGQADPILIEIPKGGYVPTFVRREIVPGEAAGESALPAVPEVALTVAAPEPAPPTLEAPPAALPPRVGSKAGAFRWLGGALAMLALVGAAYATFRFEAWGQRGISSAAALGTPTLLIMPFAALGEGPDVKLYASGLTEEILTQLARFKELTVFGRETARGVETLADATRLRRKLGVRYVLEGGVRAFGNRVRVTGRLLDADTNAVVWSQAYEDDLQPRGLIAVEDDIAQKVATVVAQPYGIIFRNDERRASQIPPEDLQAYGCTLQYYAYRAELSPAGHATARACLERTVKAYPSYALAWAMLSGLYLDEGRFGFNARPGPPDAFNRALDAARRATQLDPEGVRALQAMMMALFFTGQPREALRVGEQALALNPNDTELLGEFGTRVAMAGDWRRGADLLEQALARNPAHSSYFIGTLAEAAYMLGDNDRAVALIRRVNLEKFPLYYVVAAIIYAEQGMTSEAAAARDTFLKMRPNFFDNLGAELAMRNYRPEDQLRLVEGARKAGFPIPASFKVPTSTVAAVPSAPGGP